MTSTKTTETTTQKKRKWTPSPQHSAQDKVQAVLAVWTERCKPVDVCRQLNVNWITFNHWQRRAMEGMLQALENRVNLTKGQALSPRLQLLLQNRCRSSVMAARLTSRLEQIHKQTEPPVTTA